MEFFFQFHQKDNLIFEKRRYGLSKKKKTSYNEYVTYTFMYGIVPARKIGNVPILTREIGNSPNLTREIGNVPNLIRRINK